MKNVHGKLTGGNNPPSQSKKKKDSLPDGMSIIPSIDNGICLKCKDINALDNLVECRMCNQQFHATCYTTRGSASVESVCSRSFLLLFRPLSAKYGQNSSRWGKMCFMCESCDTLLDEMSKAKINKSCFSQTEPTNVLDVSVQCATEIASHSEDGNSLMINKMESLISSMKNEILTEVSQLVDSKFTHEHNVLPQPLLVQNSHNASLSPSPSYSDIIVGAPKTPENQQQLLFISPETESGLSTEEVKEKVDSLKRNISVSLKDVPTNFLKTNNNKGSITVAFPDSETREKATKLINDLNLPAVGFQTKHGKRLLPKLSVDGIDTGIFEGIDQGLSYEDKREQQKRVLKNSIINKNTCIKSLVDSGHTLEIVYVNMAKNSSNVSIALKVSPSIRSALFTAQHGRIFIGNNSLDIEDRFYFKQCYHCQQIGHVSTDCPKKDSASVCFYCMGSHQSKSCTLKRSPSNHCCAKCYHSTVPGEKDDCRSHNAADPLCPVRAREVTKIANNTEIHSKNVM